MASRAAILAMFSMLIAVVAGCTSAQTSPAVQAPRPAPLVSMLDSVEISLVRDGPRERQAREQLERILRTYDVRPWMFTRKIQIQSGVIPHSHPILTLNTRYLDRDTVQLSTLLHEQLHWFVDARPALLDSVMNVFKTRYPNAPGGPPTGARDLESTYLHLLVCYLELDALSHVVGAETARRTLAAVTHYTWVYDKVLNDPSVGALVRARGFIPKR